ncbi:glycosyltransferase family 2 protein, partial [Candidatus Roizmanbacteria bacterium]|nr:glycosyltransferase family 2 protein [Candidatus Roizmanbacteria bacterium]
MKTVFIILVNWNGWSDTIDCLNSLARIDQTGLRVEIVVVDNHSSDDSVERLTRYIKSDHHRKQTITLLPQKRNTGFSGGNNCGIQFALSRQADYILLLNNDTIVDRKFLLHLTRFLAENGQAGMVSPKIYFAKGYEFHKNRYQQSERGRVIWYAGGIIDWNNMYCSHRGVDEIDSGQYSRPEQTAFLSGCAMLIRKEVFASVGLLDEHYFLYYEDVDFCMRVSRSGYGVYIQPEAVMWHKNAQSTDFSG